MRLVVVEAERSAKGTDQTQECSRAATHPNEFASKRFGMAIEGQHLCGPCFARAVVAGEFSVFSGSAIGVAEEVADEPDLEVVW